MKITVDKPNLTTYQEDFLYNNARFTIIEASTKVGKTFSCLWWFFEQAHLDTRKPNENIWWVAPVYSQAKIAFNRLRARLGKTGVYKINETTLMITCPNGVVMQFKSAEKPDNLFGEDVFAVVFDEAPRARVEAFYALRSTITATQGHMKLIGNFGGTANWMHQLKEQSKTDDQYAYFKVTAWDAVREGILQESEILQAQKDLPPKIFKQLYLAEEQESDDQLCSFKAINSLWTNDHVEKSGNMFITADIALHGSDKFVVYVWDGLRVVEETVIGKTDAPAVEKLLKDKAIQYQVQRHNIAYDADGLGAFLRGYLEGAEPFVNGSKAFGDENYKNLKSQCGYKLADYINSGFIYFDCDINKAEMIKELECLQSYALDKGGKIQLMPKAKIKEIIGHSPDRLDALLIRMLYVVQPKKQETFLF